MMNLAQHLIRLSIFAGVKAGGYIKYRFGASHCVAPPPNQSIKEVKWTVNIA